MQMIDAGYLGELVVRIAVGAFLLPHGIPKLLNFREEAAEFDAEFDFAPGWLLASAVIFIQIASAAMIIIGVAVIPNLVLVVGLHIGAMILKTGKNGWFWHQKGIEYNLFWSTMAAAACLQHYARNGFSML
jgi:uncharacterized membrane protein YphA (DoxX/SURF4 family)